MPANPSPLLALLATLAPAWALAAPQAPYSLPWQLRPTEAVNVVRSDTAFALSSPQGVGRSYTTASMLLASYKLTPRFSPLVRLGYVNHAPGTGTSGASLVNPALGAVYALPLSDSLRLGLFLGVTLPLGMGGGNAPEASRAAAARSGILARSAMDNAMFAVNDLTVFPGVGLSYVTVALGPRLHFKLSDSLVVRPGLAYAFALDAPMRGLDYSILQLEVPVLF